MYLKLTEESKKIKEKKQTSPKKPGRKTKKKAEDNKE